MDIANDNEKNAKSSGLGIVLQLEHYVGGGRMEVGTVLADPSFWDGEIVRVVEAPGNKVSAETWRHGSWVIGGDPAAA